MKRWPLLPNAREMFRGCEVLGAHGNGSSLRSARGRRGVLLLVVLSLLVLFALIGVTFVLVASQSRRMSRADSRAEQYGDDHRKQLDEIFAQCVRDTTNPHSVLQGHSLLNDLYGHDGAKGTIFATPPPTPIAGGQFIDITVEATAAPTALKNVAGSIYPTAAQVQTPGYYNGCVLTMTDGVAKGVSARIVGWGYNAIPLTYTIRVMAIEGLEATKLSNVIAGNSFLINGRPFNGTGFGFNPNALPGDPTRVHAAEPIAGVLIPYVPYALLPNPVFFQPNSTNIQGPYTQFGGIGGADEDYDAPDPQNMLLAYMPINPINSSYILPSLHRPDLIMYTPVYSNPTNLPSALDRQMVDRQVSLRPTADDHFYFPRIDDTAGPWDVDNDGDGIADSVWVDVGLPVQTAPDGRRFKPMAAILCLDLDGRLNVNAHGSVAQVDTSYSTSISPGGGTPTIADYLYSTTGSGVMVTLPRGSGYGPAEINLGLTPGIFVSPLTDYPLFFRGRTVGTRNYEGRYGEFTALPYPLPGMTGLTGADDVLDSIKRFDFPNNYYASPLSSYGTPGDLWGRAVMGVDYAGQPIWSFLNSPLGTSSADLPNDPYALNLSHSRIRSAALSPTLNDNAFTASELERILRKFDIDASSLPDRLRILLDPTNPNDLGRMITTDSYDLPSPSMLPTRDMAETLLAAYPGMVPNIGNLQDLLRAKLIKLGGYMLPLSLLNQATVNNQVATLAPALFPPEVLSGVRFDLNRPFGNGVDDSPAGTPGAGVVDEPGEYGANKEAPATWTTQFGAVVPLDLNNDGTTIGGNDLYARQQYAKYLYILMMLFADQNYAWAQDSGANVTPAVQQELTARRIAQWAVNVADFRDPDSIMTPFEYDVNPFNGWDVDGIVGMGSTDDTATERRLVWGCEAPELLLTETMALHDRRVKDLASPGGLRNDSTPDPDMDQPRIPQGSVFFELYCPHNGNASMKSAYSADLYDNSGAQPQLDLGRLSPADASGNTYPVWQIAITRSTASGAANDINSRVAVARHPDRLNFDPPGSDAALGSVFDLGSVTGGQVTIERYVWFSSTDPSNNPNAAQIFYNSVPGSPKLLSPGQYAVVGPRATTYVGLTTGSLGAAQQIALNTGAGTMTYTSTGAAATTYQALPIICTSNLGPTGVWPANIGVSISEPLFSGAYYQIPTLAGPTGATDTYSALLSIPDNPLDSALSGLNAPLTQDAIWSTGLKENYKTALLQRLANPLVAYDPTTNPYITVDWQPIDLNVFNGEAAQPSPNGDPDDLGFRPPPLSLVCGSRERGTGTAASPTPDLWKEHPTLSNTIPVNKGTTTAVYDYNFAQTLGYLNAKMGTPWGSGAPTVYYNNAPDPTISGVTFPWLTWNNRPFTSNTELLLVPATSAEQLVRQFSTYNTVATPGPYNSNANASNSATPVPLLPSPFTHLLNFYSSNNGAADKAPEFHRLLEYVHVPSRFVGTETFLKPSNFVDTLWPSASGLTEQELASQFHPPFNKVSNYRDPGRVNINTIPDFAGTAASLNNPIWDAILNGGPGPTWQQIVASRRGYGASNQPVLHPLWSEPIVRRLSPPPSEVRLSTYFTNPFRSFAGATLGLPGTAYTQTLPRAEWAPLTLPRLRDVDVTLMRPDRAAPDPSTNVSQTALTDTPLFNFTDLSRPYMNPNRSPHFRYSPLERMSNLLTTRSNVYAVWITVGYFDATPARFGVDVGHPDGYQLGRELGSDSGEIKRHRAFYIYDRSIPVGFEPGRDHNFDKGVLVKRFIE